MNDYPPLDPLAETADTNKMAPEIGHTLAGTPPHVTEKADADGTPEAFGTRPCSVDDITGGGSALGSKPIKEGVDSSASAEMGSHNEDAGSSSFKGIPGALVPETEFGRVDADFYATLIPASKDPQGDRVLKYKLRQETKYVADIDFKGRLLSDAREYQIAKKLVGLQILLRVRHFNSEAEAKEFVYQCHDGGRNYTPADLRRMRHARVGNLLTIPNMTYAEIARRTGMEESSIRKIRNRIFPGLKRKDGRRVSADKEAQVKEMLAQGCGVAQISARTGVSKATIRRKSKPAPTRAPSTSAEAEQVPEAVSPVAPERQVLPEISPDLVSSDRAVQEAPQTADRKVDTGDSPASALAKEGTLDDVTPAEAGDMSEAYEVDDLTHRAVAQAGMSMDSFLKELEEEVEDRAVYAVQALTSDIEPNYVLGVRLIEREFIRRVQAHLDREILEMLGEVPPAFDDRSKPYAALAAHKAGPQKKSAGSEVFLTESVPPRRHGNHLVGNAGTRVRSTRSRSGLSNTTSALKTSAISKTYPPKRSASDRSTSSSEAHRVSRSPASESDREWMTRVAHWHSDSLKLLQSQNPGGSFSKTCRASKVQKKDEILEPSSGCWRNSGMGGPTGRLTLDTSVSPHHVSECWLSDIVETGDVPGQSCLSETASSGLLYRAEKAGKTPPEPLVSILQAVSQQRPPGRAAASASTQTRKAAKWRAAPGTSGSPPP